MSESRNAHLVLQPTQQVAILVTIAHIVVLQDTLHLQLLVVLDIIELQKQLQKPIHLVLLKLVVNVTVAIIVVLQDTPHLQRLVVLDII